MNSTKKTTPLKEALKAKAGLIIEPQPAVSFDQGTVDEGRKSLAARGKAASANPSIDSKFKFSSLDSDAELNYLHVEALLQQAAALLDRCEAERSRYELLRGEQWKLQVELDQLSRLDQVDQREREAGRDTLHYKRALIEAAAEKGAEEHHRDCESQLKQLLEELLSSGFNKRMAARELSAWLVSYPLKDHDLSGDDATYLFDGAKKTKPDHLYDAARMEADEAAWEQVYSLMAQRYAALAAAEAARFRRESFDLLAIWSKAEIGFRAERALAAKEALLEKVSQAQAQGGLLNYKDRIATSERRFATDFRESLARLTAARRGLKDLFDYAVPLPEEGSAGYFDQVVLWTRQATNRISQISASDQDYVLALSLKDLAKSQWEAGRQSSDWTFDIPIEMFKGQAHVRLRGVGLAVVGQKQEEPGPVGKKVASKKSDSAAPEVQKPEGFWSGQISAPAAATVRLSSGATREVDQKSLQACYLGRISDRDARAPEIAGGNPLHNASPIGKGWRLSLSQKSTDGTPTDTLQDVQLYLHIAVRSLR